MKTAEELNTIKNDVEALNKKLAKLSDEDLLQVTGGTTEAFNTAAEKVRAVFTEYKFGRMHGNFVDDARKAANTVSNLDKYDWISLGALINVLAGQL